jgi:hypothetical protein
MLLLFVELDTPQRGLHSLRRNVKLVLEGRQQSHSIQVDYRERRVDTILETAGLLLIFEAQSLVVSSQKRTPREILHEHWVGGGIFFLWARCPTISSHGVLPLLVAR